MDNNQALNLERIPAEESKTEDAKYLHIDILKIQPYDRNPQRCPNIEYDRIKASISSQRLDQPLVVTQRPNETNYLLFAGGNTRLQILLELYEESQNDRFRWLDCLYRPWENESDVLVLHLREIAEHAGIKTGAAYPLSEPKGADYTL